ncbi:MULTISPECIES: class I lanthipeptide [unclassified Flavobacterium]|uniref:class I lanthipeptide n=1 Tax=unclassified Flavobacterium TaxID=196869 RepID=UPI00361F1D52
MKRQNANNKLAFNKAAITELNDTSLTNVHGGSSETVSIAITIYLVTMKVVEYVQEQQAK